MKKLITASCALIFCGQAFAAGEGYTLNYSAEDLKSVAGAKQVHGKILRTAREYCPSYFVTKDLSDRSACVADVVNDLVGQIDHPTLTAVHTNDKAMLASLTRQKRSSTSG